MRLFIQLIVVTSLLMGTHARAGEPLELLQGYGKTRWGQTVEEVQELYGDQIKGMDGHASGSGADPVLSDDVSVIDLKLPDPDPLVSAVLFRFLGNHLCAVEVTLATKVREVTNNETLAKIIWDKYYADPKIRAQLAQNHLLVWLRYTGRKPEPQGPADLVPTEHFLSSVWYENREQWNQQVSEARKRVQQTAEETRRAASEINLKAVL